MSILPTETYRMSSMLSTPYPNRLLDFSTRLPETQLRVLNLVVRATLGWQEGSYGQRRAWTRLTVMQLNRRVGRTAPAATIEALAALVSRGVIDVTFLDGRPVPMGVLHEHRRDMVRVRVCPFWVVEE